MRTETIPKIYTGTFKWDKNVGENIVVLLDNDRQLLKNSEPLLPQNFICNAFLDELYTVEQFPSLPKALLPNWADEDSRRERVLKTYDMQWKSERLDCNLFVTGKTTITSPGDWCFIGTIPFLNTEGFKYTRHSAFDLLSIKLARGFGERAKLGMQIQQVGQYPFASIDSLTVDYTWRQEARLIQEDYTPVQIQTAQVTQVTAYSELITSTIALAARQVAPAREKRISFQITNNGSTTIYYSLNSSAATATSNDGVVPPASTREVINHNGTITAASSGAAGNITTRDRYQAV